MQIHSIKREHPNKKARQVGRGGTRGKTSGRGGKGQTARAGNKRRPQLRDIIKKLPKLRGYRFNSIQTKPRPVNLESLNIFVKLLSLISMNLLLLICFLTFLKNKKYYGYPTSTLQFIYKKTTGIVLHLVP